jgi:hypothetical protein
MQQENNNIIPQQPGRNIEWLHCDVGTGSAVHLGHFYSPYPDRDSMYEDPDFYEKCLSTNMPGIDLRESEQLEFLKTFSLHDSKPDWSIEPHEAFRYYYKNYSFEFYDVACLKAVLSRYRPKKIVEVGSGYSTAALFDIKDACRYEYDIVCIEPYPQRLENLLRPEDIPNFTLHKDNLQDISLDLFKKLSPNDIAFFDCSHVVKFGSDVNYMFSQILPVLPAGVIVHIHDIFYPFEYPKHWIYDEKRAWNEAYILRAFLTGNSDWEIIFWADWVTSCKRDIHAKYHPLSAKHHSGSIWLRKVK